MVVAAYLNFMGKADGESVAKGRAKWVDLSSWSWAIQADTSWTKGGGAAIGKPNPGALTFVHTFDSASPALLNHITAGAAFTQAQLVVADGQAPDAAFTMTLDGVFVTAIRNGFDGEVITQEVDIVFKAVKIDYRAQDHATGALQQPKTYTWDIPAGATTGPSN